MVRRGPRLCTSYCTRVSRETTYFAYYTSMVCWWQPQRKKERGRAQVDRGKPQLFIQGAYETDMFN